MPTVEEMVQETKKREANKKKITSRAKATKTKVEKAKETLKNQAAEAARRPATGLRSQIEQLWIFKKFKERLPETYSTVFEAAKIWQTDGSFSQLHIDPPVVKQAVVETLVRAKTIEKFVLSQPIIKRFFHQAEKLFLRFG